MISIVLLSVLYLLILVLLITPKSTSIETKDTYGFYKDGKWTKCEESALGDSSLKSFDSSYNNTAIGKEILKSHSYQPVKLEEWQTSLIKEAKKNGLAGIEISIEGNPVFINF